MEASDIAILVIGVPSRYRGRSLESQIGKLNLSFLNIDGLDGNTLSRLAMSKITDDQISKLYLKRTLSAGEISQSFLTDLKKINVEKENPTIVQLYGLDKYKLQIRRWPQIVEKTIAAQSGDSTVRVKKYWDIPELTHGYLINKSAAKIATNKMEGQRIITPADWPIQWRQEIDFYISVDEIVGNGNLESLIEEERNHNFANRAFKNGNAKKIKKLIFFFKSIILVKKKTNQNLFRIYLIEKTYLYFRYLLKLLRI